MTAKTILAIDQGTTGSTVLVVDFQNESGPKVVARHTVNFKQYFPKSGWVEHDLNEIWQSVLTAIDHCKVSPGSIAAIGVTNQRETLCVFDRKTGEPLCKAIVWQCKRSTEICKSLKEHEKDVHEKTGLFLDPYFSGTKLRWLIENDSEVAKKLTSGEAIVGTIDSYLMYRLTGCMSHVTEASNASRTLLFNLHTGAWDDDLLKMMKIPSKNILPEIKNSAGIFGKTKGMSLLPDGIPIAGCLGDQQAALAGQTCFEVGQAKCTYGTGAFFLANIGMKPIMSSANLLTTVAWKLKDKITYALEGSTFVSGAAVQFLRDQLGLIENSADTEPMAKDVNAAPDLYFVPALSGLGAPYWNPKACGAILGMTRGTSKAQIVRATLEGMTFEVNELIRAMEKDLAKAITVLRVDGGATSNNVLMQIQSNISQVQVERPKNLETTAFGAALFAAYGVRILSSLDDLHKARQVERTFEPESSAERKKMFQLQLDGWKRAVKAVQVFSEN